MASQSNQTTSNASDMRVLYHWNGDELMIECGGITCTYNEFQLETWNELTRTATKQDTLGSVAEKYAKEISITKHRAIKYGDAGMRIVKEITRLATRQLELAMKLAKKSAHGNNTPHVPICVTLNAKTMTVVCSTCGCSPKDGKKLMKCSRCCAAFYCDLNCQKSDWKEHKTKCCC